MKVFGSRSRGNERPPPRAFSLLEVLIASTILAIALMGILTLCSTGMKVARALQQTHVDASSIAAWTSITNRLEEGVESGDFYDLMGDAAPRATWVREIREVQSNGLFQVDYTVTYSLGGKPVESHLSTLLFRPASVRRSGR